MSAQTSYDYTITSKANGPYKYDEPDSMKEIVNYIDSTYKAHYSKGSLQVTEMLMAMDRAEDFCIGNVLKYLARYGHKNGKNRTDLLKAIHFLVIALKCNTKEQLEREEVDNVAHVEEVEETSAKTTVDETVNVPPKTSAKSRKRSNRRRHQRQKQRLQNHRESYSRRCCEAIEALASMAKDSDDFGVESDDENSVSFTVIVVDDNAIVDGVLVDRSYDIDPFNDVD